MEGLERLSFFFFGWRLLNHLGSFVVCTEWSVEKRKSLAYQRKTIVVMNFVDDKVLTGSRWSGHHYSGSLRVC